MDDTTLANLALAKIGAEPIISINDPTKAARIAKSYVGYARELTLSSYPWRCARARERLEQVTDTDLVEDDEYQYAYDLPTECVQAIRLASGQQFMVEGRALYTNEAPDNDGNGPILVYTANLAPDALPAYLVAPVAARLAIILAASLGGDKYMMILDQALERGLREARAADARGGKSLPEPSIPWTSIV